LIHREEDIETARSSRQEIAVFPASESSFPSCEQLVREKLGSEPFRKSLVKHTRMRQNGFLGLFHRSDSLFSAHGGKVGKEFSQGLAFLKVVDQRLERNPGADEYRCPFKDLGVPVDCALMFHASASWKP
jgi:hypothetical protein